jgi:hypothetical protein
MIGMVATQTSLPSAVRATLNHALFQAFRPEGNLPVDAVYVCGNNNFNRILATRANGQMVSPTNWYTERNMYILNRTLHEDSGYYGPFTMDDIWKMPRITTVTALECMGRLEKYWQEQYSLCPSFFWELYPSGGRPRKVDAPPISIQKSDAFVRYNYQPELSKCEGVIIVPLVVTREDSENESIRIIKRDGFHITLIKRNDRWFILQTCRTAFFEDNHFWYVYVKEIV